MIRYDLLFRGKSVLKCVSLKDCYDYLVLKKGIIPPQHGGKFGYQIHRRVV